MEHLHNEGHEFPKIASLEYEIFYHTTDKIYELNKVDKHDQKNSPGGTVIAANK